MSSMLDLGGWVAHPRALKVAVVRGQGSCNTGSKVVRILNLKLEWKEDQGNQMKTRTVTNGQDLFQGRRCDGW